MARLYDSIVGMDVRDVATRLTLLLLLLYDQLVGVDWYWKLPLRVVAVVALIVPPLHRSFAVWVLIALLIGSKTVEYWWFQDNHHFLTAYWCVALGLSLGLREKEQTKALAFNARLLVGLSFLFATLWKAFLSPDFVDGAYFHYTFLTDARFQELGLLLTGMSEEASQHNQALIAELRHPTAGVESVVLQDAPRMLLLARLVTWWTIAIEGGLALTFLLPDAWRLGTLRNGILLLFVWTTYTAASNVTSFGWILATLGLAQCSPKERFTRLLYLASFPLLLVYSYFPILGLLRLLTQGQWFPLGG